MRIEKLRREFDLNVRWSMFPLHPETPPGGVDLHDLFAGRMDVAAALARLRLVAGELELPFGERTRTFNSRKAQELAKWAEEKGAGGAFHQAVYRAYFDEGKNIARPDVLAAVAGSVGLDPEMALQIAESGRFAAAVDDDWQRAGQLGVTAVPTLLFQGRRLVGFQSDEVCRAFVAGTEEPDRSF